MANEGALERGLGFRYSEVTRRVALSSFLGVLAGFREQGYYTGFWRGYDRGFHKCFNQFSFPCKMVQFKALDLGDWPRRFDFKLGVQGFRLVTGCRRR